MYMYMYSLLFLLWYHSYAVVFMYMYRRQLEFLINGNIVPHNMTVFQAIKMYAIVSDYLNNIQ